MNDWNSLIEERKKVRQRFITTEQRWDDWHACITGETAMWASGNTEAEAIGHLWQTYGDEIIEKIQGEQE